MVEDKNVAIISRAWYPNHQILFDQIQTCLPENIKLYYFLLSVKERHRPWELKQKCLVPPRLVPGIHIKLFSKEIMINPSLAKCLSKIKIDLMIITPWSELGSFMAKKYAQKRQIPAVGWIVGLREWNPNLIWKIRSFISRKVAKMFMNGLRCIFADGAKAKNDALELGIFDENIKIVKHSIDEDNFDYLNLKNNRNNNKISTMFKDDKKYTFLCISQLIERKGILLLLKTFDLFSKENNNSRLLIIGDGPLKKELKEASSRNKNILWIKSVLYDDIPLYYSIADCCIVPSLFDDWCNVVNESMCAKVPVICSSGANASFDLIKHDSTGLVYEFGNMRQLLRNMKYSYQNQEHMKKMAENAYDFIKSNWNTKISAEIWSKYIKRSLEY